MKRYRKVMGGCDFEEDSKGQFCFWVDVDALLAQCEEALAELLSAYRGNYDRDIVGRDVDGHPLNGAGVAARKADAALTAIRAARVTP